MPQPLSEFFCWIVKLQRYLILCRCSWFSDVGTEGETYISLLLWKRSYARTLWCYGSCAKEEILVTLVWIYFMLGYGFYNLHLDLLAPWNLYLGEFQIGLWIFSLSSWLDSWKDDGSKIDQSVWHQHKDKPNFSVRGPQRRIEPASELNSCLLGNKKSLFDNLSEWHCLRFRTKNWV